MRVSASDTSVPAMWSYCGSLAPNSILRCTGWLRFRWTAKRLAAPEFARGSSLATYSLSGEVLRGDGLGQQLGFPTANIDTDGLVLPPNGVYAVRAELPNGSHRAVLNIGVRPTLRSPKPRLQVEAHLLDFSGDLYGKTLEVVFVDKLRNECQFNSMQELRDQIGKDILEARERF